MNSTITDRKAAARFVSCTGVIHYKAKCGTSHSNRGVNFEMSADEKVRRVENPAQKFCGKCCR